MRHTATRCGPLCRPDLARCSDSDGYGAWVGWRVGSLFRRKGHYLLSLGNGSAKRVQLSERVSLELWWPATIRELSETQYGPLLILTQRRNLATYATLFGMSWLEPIIWRFQSWLYSKCVPLRNALLPRADQACRTIRTLLTLCPSPSTQNMLLAQSFDHVRLWPRGVDLSHFSPSKRSSAMRASWGVGDAPRPVPAKEIKVLPMGVHFAGGRPSLPPTPPASPAVEPVDVTSPSHLPSRVVLLYVGRV